MRDRAGPILVTESANSSSNIEKPYRKLSRSNHGKAPSWEKWSVGFRPRTWVHGHVLGRKPTDHFSQEKWSVGFRPRTCPCTQVLGRKPTDPLMKGNRSVFFTVICNSAAIFLTP